MSTMAQHATRSSFPDTFLWGASTSAYQIEGATDEDGRTESIWDTLCRRPGAILDGSSGDTAIDHYHRLDDDLDLIPALGLNAYRFSLAWPRLQPDGSGPLNKKGLDFYARMFDGLHDRGITPVPTLFHWDLPQALEDRGGWTSRDTALRFADYAAAVHARLGDRADLWTTLNEPWCASFLGYASGEHAPGRTEPASAVTASHHLLLGHGLAVQAMRAAEASTRVSIALNLYDVVAASTAPIDMEARRRLDGLQNRWFLDPIFRGSYPEDVVSDLRGISSMDHVQDDDLAIIAAPLDALCINYYSSFCTRGHEAPLPRAVGARPTPWVGTEDVELVDRGLPRSAMGWDIDPVGLTRVLTRVRDTYTTIPLMITENGLGDPDPVTGGVVEDSARWDYIRDHLGAVRDAMLQQVDVRGYFPWSLIDNFEWAWGYSQRFGLVHVDLETQQRTWKRSAHEYRAFLAG